MSNFVINESKPINSNSPTLFNYSFNKQYPESNNWTNNNLLVSNVIKSFILYVTHINNYDNTPTLQNNYSFFGLYDITKAIFYKDINNV